MKAVWNGTTIAESDDAVVIENNHYFPADSIKMEKKTKMRLDIIPKSVNWREP
jgi:uncharacterized protein (DUF427 family)